MINPKIREKALSGRSEEKKISYLTEVRGRGRLAQISKTVRMSRVTKGETVSRYTMNAEQWQGHLCTSPRTPILTILASSLTSPVKLPHQGKKSQHNRTEN